MNNFNGLMRVGQTSVYLNLILQVVGIVFLVLGCIYLVKKIREK